MEAGTHIEIEYDETLVLCSDHVDCTLNVLFKDPSHAEQKDFVRQLQAVRKKRLINKIYGTK